MSKAPLIALVAAVLLLIVPLRASAQSSPTPFPCNGQLYQIATSNSTLKALNFVQSGNGYTTNFTDINSAGANLNSGWGYNELDNLIYGVRNNTRELYRIDFDGNFDLITTLDNTFERGSFVGDVLPNGIMIYRSRNNSREWQLVDISDPFNPVNNGVITLTQVAGGADFAYNPVDGMMYGIHSGNDRLFYVDIDALLSGGGSATPVFFGPPAGTYTGGYGAMWFDEDGRLYTYDNNTNEIQVINVGIAGNGTGNATFLAVSTDEEGGTNDGAYCRGPAPVPLGSITGTVYEDIDSDDSFGLGEPTVGAGVSVSVYYDNGTQADLSDDIFIGSTETENDGTYFFDGLVTIETFRVEVDASDPDLPQNSSLGTTNPLIGVQVFANNTTQNLNFGFDPGIADLEITKTADKSTALPGETVTWTISVTNNGNGSPANVMVSDLIPDGFTYVSDDAPAVGDYYDPANGNWFVDEILIGDTETLTIVTTANDGGERTNYAEIIFSSMPDPDSDFTVGRLVVDGTDDDEAFFTVAQTAGSSLSGRVFLDNGSDGGTAFDALLNGSEAGGQFATLSLTDGTGAVLATPIVNADGSWLAGLVAGFSGTVTITATPESGYVSASEADPGLPSLSNPSQTDGSYTFTPDAATSYAGLDFGLIAPPTLEQSQTTTLAPGQIAELAHRYEATTTGTVSFALVDPGSSPEGAFSTTLFEDTDCDGAPDDVLTTPVSVVAGQSVCLIARTQSASSAGTGASYSYGLTAQTQFTGSPLASMLRNDDRITGSAEGQITLRKLVRNVTRGTAEGTVNAGGPGDVLRYRLLISNPGTEPAIDILVNDATPAWTSLSAPLPASVSLTPDINCSVSIPSGGGNAGYIGPIEWTCPGNFLPGAQGSLGFDVTID